MDQKQGFSKLLECPVCWETMHAPIYQCNRGHTICAACKARVTTCPTCRAWMGNIRCLALEQAMEFVALPCEWAYVGCKECPELHRKEEHENSCSFRPFKCLMDSCNESGNVTWLIKHLKGHPEVRWNPGPVLENSFLVADEGAYHPEMYSAFGEFFCLFVEVCKLDGPLCYVAWVQYLGDDMNSHRFRYSLEVSGHERSLCFKGIPRSLRDSREEVRDSHDCLIVRKNMIDYYSTQDKDGEAIVTFSGRISPVSNIT